MMIKKIGEMDLYELLNLRFDASPKEIENAYLLAVATYHEESLASYGALGHTERGFILDRIEEAFQTLHDPEKKKTYDLLVLQRHPEFQQRASLRRSTRKLEIEGTEEGESLLDKFKAAFSRRWRGRDGREQGKNGLEQQRLPRDFYYYGDYLKKVRERRGLSREDIAARCGISLERLELLEKENLPSFPHEEKLLEGLRLYAKCLGLGSENKGASRPSDRFTD